MFELSPLDSFCVALSKVIPYSQSQFPGQCEKPYWGQRAQNSIDQYAKYVPPEFVEDGYSLSTTGCSGRSTQEIMQFIHPRTLVVATSAEGAREPPEAAAGGDASGDITEECTPVTPAGKYNHNVHVPLIIDACGGAGSAQMRSKNDIKKLADQMNLEFKQVKYGIAKLVKSGDLLP